MYEVGMAIVNLWQTIKQLRNKIKQKFLGMQEQDKNIIAVRDYYTLFRTE